MSFGRYPFNFAIAIQVTAKANKTPIKATSACSYVPNKYIIFSSFGLSPDLIILGDWKKVKFLLAFLSNCVIIYSHASKR